MYLHICDQKVKQPCGIFFSKLRQKKKNSVDLNINQQQQNRKSKVTSLVEFHPLVFIFVSFMSETESIVSLVTGQKHNHTQSKGLSSSE